MEIRTEDARDAEAIHDLTARAFAPMRFADGTEPDVIRGLRRDGHLTLSLVAAEDGVILGHVAFSPVTIGAMDGWFGLGPIAVEPARQRQGIGRRLVVEGLKRLRDAGAWGVALTGNPAVYGPMGFISDGRLSHGDTPSRNILYQVLRGSPPQGELIFAPAFGEA